MEYWNILTIYKQNNYTTLPLSLNIDTHNKPNNYKTLRGSKMT